MILIKKLSNNELVQGDDIDNSIIPFDNLLLDVLTKCKNKKYWCYSYIRFI